MLKAGNVMLTAFFVLNGYSAYFSAKFLLAIIAIKTNPTKNTAIPG